MTKEKTILVKENGNSQKSTDLMQVYKTLTFDVPMASMRLAFGSTNSKESTLALWKGYDAGVRLATSTIDSLYRSPSLSELVGTTVNQMLRIQQLSTAASKFFMTGLLQPLALPVPAEVQPASALVDAPLSEPTPARAPTRTRRARPRKTQLQESDSASTYPLPQSAELRAAA